MDRWILAIADDLTGALEVGAKFAGGGYAACVTTATETVAPPDVPVLVVDTESRHLPEMDARAVVRKIAEQLRDFRPWLVYKKTDSTLRVTSPLNCAVCSTSFQTNRSFMRLRIQRWVALSEVSGCLYTVCLCTKLRLQMTR